MLYTALSFQLLVSACMGARVVVTPDEPVVDKAFTQKTTDDLKLIKATLVSNGVDRREAARLVKGLQRELHGNASSPLSRLNFSRNLSGDLNSMREALTKAGVERLDVEGIARSLLQEVKNRKVSLDLKALKEALAALEERGAEAGEMVAAVGRAARTGEDLLHGIEAGLKAATQGLGVIAEGVEVLRSADETTGQKVLASVKIIAGVSQIFNPVAGTALASLCSFASAFLKDEAAPGMTSAIKSAISESFEEMEDEQTRLNLAADLSELDASFSGLHVLYQNVADARENAYSVDWLVSVGWLADRAVAYPGRRGLGRLREFLRPRSSCASQAFGSEDCARKARNFYRYAVLSHAIEVVHQAARDLAIAMQATHSTLPQVESAMKDLQVDDQVVFCKFLEAGNDESRWALKDALRMDGFGLDAAEQALVFLKLSSSGCLPPRVSPGAFFTLQNGGGKNLLVGLNPSREGVKGHGVALATQRDHQWSLQPTMVGSECPGCFTIVNRASGCVLYAGWEWVADVGCHDADIVENTAVESSQHWLVKYRGDHVVLVNKLTNGTLVDQRGKGDLYAIKYNPEDIYNQWVLDHVV